MVRPPPRSREPNWLGLGWGMRQGGHLSWEGWPGWDGGWLGMEERWGGGPVVTALTQGC